MNFYELNKYCKENTQLPGDTKKPFVVAYQINIYATIEKMLHSESRGFNSLLNKNEFF